MTPASSRRWLALVLAQICLVLGSTELGLRLLRPHVRALRILLYEPSFRTPYERARDLPELLEMTMLGYRPFASVYGFVLNSRSLRTREYATEKPPGTYRVLAMGDSFAFDSGGLPHGDHWPTLLEARLAERTQQRVEVLRLGVPGTSTEFQIRLWQLEGRFLDANRVILAFFVGNDFVENRGAAGRAEPPGGAERLAAHSLTFRLLRNLLRVRRGATRVEPWHPAAEAGARRSGGYEIEAYRARFDPEQPTLGEAAFLEIESDRMSLFHASRRAEFERLLERSASDLAALEREVRSAGAELLVMIVPDEFQVHPDVARAAARHAQTELAEYDLDLPQRRLDAALDASGIPHVDLLVDFREAAAQQRVYQARDTHWNRAGNELATLALLRSWDPGS